MNEKYIDNSTLIEYYKNGDRFQCGNEVWELFYKSDNGTRGKVKLVMKDGVEQDGSEKNTITFKVEWRVNKPYVTQKIGTRQARQIVNENNMKTRKTNKKALYESIMKKVSRSIKETLNESMSDDDSSYVKDVIVDMLREKLGADSQDANEIADAVLQDVIVDIEATADPNYWHSGDVEIAFIRVIKSKLGL